MPDLKAKEGCCEEASLMSKRFYIPCNAPAAFIVKHDGRDEGPYRMCAACADHNVRNRGGRVVETLSPPPEAAPQTVPPAMQITEYNATAAGLADLRGRLANVVYDVTTTAGMDMARKDRAEVRGLRLALEKKRVEIKAPALERSRLIDAEAKLLTAQLEALETPIDEAIKREERRKEEARAEKERVERNRVIDIRGRIDSMARIPLLLAGASSSRLAKAAEDLEAQPVTTETYQEFLDEALNVKRVVMRQIGDAFTAKLAEEQEAARLKAEREAFEAERAAEAKRQEEAKAEADRLERQRLARIEAEDMERRAKAADEEREARQAREKADAEAKALREAEDARVRDEHAREAARIETARKEVIARQEEERETERRRLATQREEQEAKHAAQVRIDQAQQVEREAIVAENERLAAVNARNEKINAARRSNAKQALVDIMGICRNDDISDVDARYEIGLIAEGTLRPAVKEQRAAA